MTLTDLRNHTVMEGMLCGNFTEILTTNVYSRLFVSWFPLTLSVPVATTIHERQATRCFYYIVDLVGFFASWGGGESAVFQCA